MEGRLLESVAPQLDVAVPDWRIHNDDLIAYPLLPGEPELTLADDGTVQWHFDVESPTYNNSLGQLLAQLHAIDPEVVADTGIERLTPAESRQAIQDDIARVKSEFEIASELLDRWKTWLADDRYWPEWSTVTRGEIYPAHPSSRMRKSLGFWTGPRYRAVQHYTRHLRHLRADYRGSRTLRSRCRTIQSECRFLKRALIRTLDRV